jgi:hypothetical protein
MTSCERASERSPRPHVLVSLDRAAIALSSSSSFDPFAEPSSVFRAPDHHGVHGVGFGNDGEGCVLR